MIRVKPREYFLTCTACEKTGVGGNVVVLGSVSVVLCGKCSAQLHFSLKQKKRHGQTATRA